MCVAALLTIFCVLAHAEDYQLKVGGKTVSSSNASNVTGDNIKPYLSSVNGGKASVTYDASTKTLTLYNVKIDRTGSGNRAILNDGISGLTVILKGRNYLKAADSSPLRFNANTYLKCEMANNSNFSEIIGGSEDAITVGNDALLKIQDANLEITSNSSAFEGAGASSHPSLIIWNSNVKATCKAYKNDDCYAVNNFSLMQITDSYVTLTGYSQAVYNLVTLERIGSYIKSPVSASFDNVKKTFTLNSGGTVKEVVFDKCPEINSENFPDAVFRKYVKDHFDIALPDEHLDPSSEGYVVEELNVSGLGISNLKGIEFFPNLEKLDCSDNKITHLNVSQNTKLTQLNCQNNQLVQLVVTGCSALNYLYCNDNQLQELNVSGQTKLLSLDCNNNKLTTLNLENNTQLLGLKCYDNLLTSLKIKTCSKLAVLQVYNNKFKGDNIGDFITNLPSVTNKELYFCKDFFSSTDNAMTLAQAKSIKDDKGWTVKMNLGGTNWIDYPGSDATVINADNFPDENFRNYVSSNFDSNNDLFLTTEERYAVTAINVDGKSISSLQGVELFTNLTKLECNNNNLQTLDIRYNKALKELHCSQNKLTELNVKNNQKLIVLSCFDNQLNELKLSWNTELENLSCGRNKLTSLSVKNNTKLATLDIEGNSITGIAMTDLVASLPNRTSTGDGVFRVSNSENTTDNEMTWNQVYRASYKGWQVMYWVGDGWVSYPGSDAIEINDTNFPDEKFRAYVAQESIDANQDGFLNPQEIADVTVIDVKEKEISDLTGIGIFTALTYLYCGGNSLTSLDVSNCKALTYLNCVGNSLTSLDVSQNTALMTLSCGGNSLTSLEVSNCTALTELYCSGNSLTSLDVSNNTALTVLYCYGNAIRGAGMTTLVNSLPETEDPRKLYVYGNETLAGNWITFKQVEKAEKKGWIVSEWDGSDWVPFAGEKDGDVDGDGKVNEADVQAIEDYIMGRAPEGTDIRLYDVNEDGVVNVADIVDLINIIKG